MPLIDKNNVNEYKVSIHEPEVHANEPDDASLIWWSYASLGQEDYLYSADSDNKSNKRYEYSTPVWYNVRKGGKKRKNRRS